MKLICDEYGYVSGFARPTNPDTPPVASPQPTPAPTSPHTNLVQCSYCPTTLPFEHLAAHIADYHSKTLPQGYTYCEHCGAQVASSRLQHHYSSAHNIHPPAFDQKDATPARNRKEARRRIACPQCGQKVKIFNLDEHLIKVHGALAVAPQTLSPTTTVVTKTHPPIPTRTHIKRELVECPHCRQNIRLDRLDRHTKKVHNIASGAKKIISVPQQNTISSEFVKCPQCGQKMHQSRLERHIAEDHNGANKPSRKVASALRRAPGNQGLVKCPHCAAFVKVHNLERHIRKNHSENTANTEPRKNKKGINYPNNQPKQNDTTPTAMQEAFEDAIYEARDGGKYVGYLRREHGRFGSFPLYDDYGDDADAW